MPSYKSGFFGSVRFKFLLWYMLALTITLFGFSLVLYGGFSKTLYGDMDDLLSSRADGIANAIDAYWEARKAFHDGDPLNAADFQKVAADWMEGKRKDPELMSIFSQVLDPAGVRIAASRSMPRLEALDAEDTKDILEGEDSFDILDGELVAGRKMRFRAYTRPVMEDGKVICIVQVAGPVTMVSLALNNLMLVLFLLLPLTVLLAGIPGILLARLTLRPVDRMMDTLRRITAENLKLKIHIPDTKDEIKRLADTFNDMIDRLDRSFTSQQRFIQDISNELKAPISALKGDFDSALRHGLSEKGYKELISKASKQAEVFSEKIENLMILSGFDDNRMALEIRKIDIGKLAEKVLDEMRPMASEKDIRVSFSSPENIVLDGDETQLKRLFMNLYDNAIKYTYRKGSVSVTVRRDGRNSKVYIIDTGVGIPLDEQEYIFDRFYQAGGRISASGGFGLGLSSAKSIIDAHHGAIAVESRPGKGSTFTVTLPLSYPG